MILLICFLQFGIRKYFYMGNCTSDYIERKTARKSFDFTNNKSNKAPLVFQIKTWPRLLSFDLKDPQNCSQRQIDASLCEGEKIQINLKSTLQVNGLSQPVSNNMNIGLRCQISKKNKCYTIRFPDDEEKRFLWKFVGNWTQIEEGDIIRMGKTKYKLSKMVHAIQSNAYKSLKSIDDSLAAATNKDLQDHRCRICLSSNETNQNPLISPCKCTGSVKYMHLKCLSSWLFDLNMEQTEYIKIRVNKSVCELCKTDIIDTPEYQRMTDMLLGNASNIPVPYSIFQVYQKEQEKEKNYFILSFSKKNTYTFGRSNKVDICDKNDRCISKFNSELIYKNQRLMIKDCESMHGTFLKVKENLNLFSGNLTEDISYKNMIIKARYMPMFEQE